MQLLKRLKSLRADRKGNVLILAAAAMPLIVGSAGLALDTIQLSLLKRHLQRAADSAALAGAYAKAQDGGFDIQAAVNKALAFNDAFPLSTATTTQPTSGTHANRAVKVDLAASRPLPFMSFFTKTPPIINVSATAALVYSGKYCMIALDETEGTGITFEGSSEVNMGCGVISNRSGPQSVIVNGSKAEIRASPIAGVGGVPGSSGYQSPTLLLPYSLKQEDPFKNLPDPPTFPTCGDEITDSSPAPIPYEQGGGAGCYRGMDVNKAMTLTPGTYFLKGNLTLNANANITAHGVTLVFTSDALTNTDTLPKITIDGNAKLDLKAPSDPTNPYDGVAIYYDRRAATLSPGPVIAGNSNLKMEGALYFPSQDMTLAGHSSMASTCIQLVARRLTFTGTTTINNSCDSGGADRFDVKWVRLVA